MTNEQRSVGQTRDTGFQIGVRRTLPVGYEQAWQLLTSAEGVRVWLGDAPGFRLAKGAAYRLPDGTVGEVTVYSHYSHLRMTWQPEGWARPSIIQVRVLPQGHRTVIVFHQEHLPGPEDRAERRACYIAAIDTLRHMIAP